MTDQDQQIQLKLQEYQVCMIMMNQVATALNLTNQQLQKLPGDINLLSAQKNFEHDYKEFNNLGEKLTHEILKHFEAKYDIKLKGMNRATMKKS